MGFQIAFAVFVIACVCGIVRATLNARSTDRDALLRDRLLLDDEVR